MCLFENTTSVLTSLLIFHFYCQDSFGTLMVLSMMTNVKMRQVSWHPRSGRGCCHGSFVPHCLSWRVLANLNLYDVNRWSFTRRVIFDFKLIQCFVPQNCAQLSFNSLGTHSGIYFIRVFHRHVSKTIRSNQMQQNEVNRRQKNIHLIINDIEGKKKRARRRTLTIFPLDHHGKCEVF